MSDPTAIVDGLNAANNRTYGYQDVQYFLTQGDGPWGTRAWTYGTIGNRLRETTNGAAADSYAAGNNSPTLDAITLGIGGVHDFTFDAAGNQTQVDLAGNVIDRTYDAASRMSRQERAAVGAWTEFRYDGRGFLRRTEGESPPAVGTAIFCDGFESGDITAWGGGGGGSVCLEPRETESVYSSEGRLHAVSRSFQPTTSRILYFGGRPVAQIDTIDSLEQTLFLTTDHLGTPILASDGAGAMVWAGGFEPFGGDYAGANQAGVFLRFPGQWVDESWSKSTPADYPMNNLWRWYSGNLGRYKRSDPAFGAAEAEPALYVYVLNNPLRLIDPSGLFSVESSCDGCTHPTLGPRFQEARRNLTSIISREVSTWCQGRLDGIKDIALRKCIKQSCHSGLIKCSAGDKGFLGRRDLCANPSVLGYSSGRGLHWLRRQGVFPRTRTATICSQNPLNYEGHVGDTVIHEWAHGCGWNPDVRPVPEGIPGTENPH